MQDRLEPPSVENLTEARRAIEAMLLVSNDPTPVQLLAQLVELPVDLVQSMCVELAGEYEDQRRGFQLAEVAGGWRFQTHPDTHAYVERFALEGIPNRLSSAALETLAIVAYKQPISRAQVGAIRGVNVDGVLRTLVQRGYVDEQGRDDGPGQATLFGTTPFFLEQLGLMSLDDLPPLGDFVPSVEVLEALENTLRVDPEPEIVIVDDDAETMTAEVASEETPSTNGHGPEHHIGSPADADADADVDAGSPADADAGSPADADAEIGSEVEPAVDDGEDLPSADDEDAGPVDGEALDIEGVTDSERDVDPEPVVDDGEAVDAALGDGNQSVTEPSDTFDPADGSTNGSSNGSSNGSVVTTNGNHEDEPVYEVLSDPAASVIPLDTHLATSTPAASGSEVDVAAEDEDVAAEDEPVREPEPAIESEPERETDVEPVGDIRDVDPDLETDGGVDDHRRVLGTADPVDHDPDQADPIDGAPDPVVAETDDEPTKPVADEPPRTPIDRVDPELVLSDELEVAADPEVEMTDGTTETGAAGVDDARFPGARSASPLDPSDRLDAGEEPGAGLGRGPSEQARWEATEDPAPSGSDPVTNGHQPDPDDGDA